jgi:hypothetical protein
MADTKAGMHRMTASTVVPGASDARWASSRALYSSAAKRAPARSSSSMVVRSGSRRDRLKNSMIANISRPAPTGAAKFERKPALAAASDRAVVEGLSKLATQ